MLFNFNLILPTGELEARRSSALETVSSIPFDAQVESQGN